MRLKIWFLILAAVLVFPVSADEKAALEAFSAGRELENQRKFLSAADSYLESQVQADEPIQKVNALISAARAYRKARKYGAEFDCLQQLAQGRVTRINYYEVVKRQFEIGGKFYEGHRDYYLSWLPFIKKDDRTIEIYEAALKNAPCGPEAPEAMLRLGRLYLDNGNPEQAIRHFSEAIKLHPDSEQARYAALELSNALLMLAQRGDGDGKNAQHALEAFDSFLAKHPDDPKSEWIKRSRDEVYNIIAARLCGIGKFYKNNRKYDVAQRYFATVIKDYPQTKATTEAEEMLAEINAEYKSGGTEWTPEKRVFREQAFPRENSDVLHLPGSGSRWLLPVRDSREGLIERDPNKQEIITDDML